MEILMIMITIFSIFLVYFAKRRYSSDRKNRRMVKLQSKLETDFRSGRHIWKSFNKKGLYYCNSCEKLMGGIFCNGMSECQKCGLLIHNLCRLKRQKLPKCKFVTTEAKMHPHQFVDGNLQFNSICSVCDLICSSIYELKGAKCIWCQRYAHTDCLEKIKEDCDCGQFNDIVIRPNQVKYTEPLSIQELKQLKKAQINREEETETDLDIQKKIGWNIKVLPNQKPIIVIINKKSGGQLGEQFMSAFYKHLNPIQVIDLINEGMGRIQIFKDIKNLKILVCGGDGTVASVVNYLKECEVKHWQEKNPPVAILPIGTGNDLGRALGWGGGGQTEEQVGDILKQVHKYGESLLHDRWKLKLEGEQKEQVVYNYFSIGLDARVCYGFHHLRDKYPYLFKSRIGNKFIYTHVGTLDMLQQKTQMLMGETSRLDEEIELIVDGITIELPQIENLAFVNISSWAGGAQNLWLSDEEIKMQKNNKYIYKSQSFCDGIIEVLGVTSMFHLGQVQINVNEPLRICQGKSIEINIKKKQYVQADGEPFIINPQKLTFNRLDQVHMLMNSKKTGNQNLEHKNLQFESKILNTLEWAEQNQHISQQQKQLLFNKFLN